MSNGVIETRSAFARRVGRSPARITQWANQGTLSPPALLDDGRIDVDAALAQLAAVLAPLPAASGRPPTASRPPSEFAMARLRREQAAARRSEIELAAVEGRYRKEGLSATVAVAFELCAALRQQLDYRRDDLVRQLRAAPDNRAAAVLATSMDRDFQQAVSDQLRAHLRKETRGMSAAELEEIMAWASELAPEQADKMRTLFGL